MLPGIVRHWREAAPLVRAEVITNAWELFSALLFISAVMPAAFSTPWPSIIFGGGLLLSSLLAAPLTRLGRRGFAWAAFLRTACWPLSVTPLLSGLDARMLVASCGFGLMAGGIRRAAYRRLVDPMPPNPSPVRLRSDLAAELSQNAMVAGIVGGHVMLLFSVAFLRTASKTMFRAWWEIIPALAILGTVAFTITVRPITRQVRAALRAGRRGAVGLHRAGLAEARAIPRRLSYVNFAVWQVCISIGVLYYQPGPARWRWADALMQLVFGSLFAWGVSFHQRGWQEDSVAPVVARLRTWTGQPAEPARTSIRSRMLTEFGLPLLFALTLSLFASIGLYRTLGQELSLQEDFNAIVALSVSFLLLVLAVGGVFLRASRQLADPLSKLARAADAVASGKLDAAVPPVRGPLEVVGLGRSVEDMRQALARTIDELRAERAGLELHVAKRTAELTRALDELKQAQTALVQGERMALIGELVASVAHEIHNPLNAIVGSVSSLERVAGELSAMLAAYEQAAAALDQAEQQRLGAKREQLDVDGALADLQGIVKVVQSATRRSVEIVGNLKAFARAPAEPIPTDLHAGLRETLSLLHHRLEQLSITVTEQLGTLPQVHCRAGEINQVFMNLLTNAIQAVEQRHPDGGGRISVRTRADGDEVAITIEDNGSGVPAALRSRIFDPFFTTKPAGQGTGMGLSISRDIVRRHGGSLTIEAPARLDGAGFTCLLPLRPKGGRARSRGQRHREQQITPREIGVRNGDKPY